MLKETLSHILAPNTPKRTFEIIVVDDGSRDDTSSVALRFSKDHSTDSNRGKGKSKNKGIDLKVVKLPRNRGKGGAVKAGILGSSGRRILMVDADGASKFEDLEKLWKDMDTLLDTHKGGKSREGKAVAVGSRAHLVKTEAVVKVCISTLSQLILRVDMYVSSSVPHSETS